MRITDRDISHESVSSTITKADLTNISALSGKASAQSSSYSSFPSYSSGTLADDSAAFSSTASLVSHTMSLPEVNAARVSDMQTALASGHFQIDSGRVASALIATMLDGAWS